MAELTNDEKIAIGVCAAVGGLILIGILIFICIVFRKRDTSLHRKQHIYYDDRDRGRHIYNDDRRYYHDRPYTVLDNYKTRIIDDYKSPPPYHYGPPSPVSYRKIALPPNLPPPPPPLAPALPPPAPLREVREVVYRKPERIEPSLVQYEGYNARTVPPRGAVEKYYRGYENNDSILRNSYTMGCPPVRGDNPRALASGLSYVQADNPWDFLTDRYTNEPIVIPLSEPDYIYSGSRVTRPNTHYIRYHDDQALLGHGSIRRNYGELRRTYSLGELGHHSNRPYVGEWIAKADDLNEFNRNAYDNGRDPFLWKNSSRDYDHVRRF